MSNQTKWNYNGMDCVDVNTLTARQQYTNAYRTARRIFRLTQERGDGLYITKLVDGVYNHAFHNGRFTEAVYTQARISLFVRKFA